MTTFSCTECGQKLRVKDELVGKEVKCPRCGARTLVSAAQPVALAPVPNLGADNMPSLPPPQVSGEPPSDANQATLPLADHTTPVSAQEAATLPPPSDANQATLPLADQMPPTASSAVTQNFAQPDAPAESSRLDGEGVHIPGYELLGELGRGGMGVVYKGRHKKLNRLVALKMILAGSHAGAADLARFQTEAQAIARLQHPNIVQVYEVGEHEGKPFFSLEFCGGGSLAGKLNATPLPASEAAALVETLARAMQAAHDQHIIHRDLKPANVLLTETGVPKITDFGLAKKLDEAGQTQAGSVMGTPSYMAPEQAGGETGTIGPLADVYTLGAILYECLTGRPPFKAATPLETIMQVVNIEPVPPSELIPKVPRDVETICLKCLDKEPHKRYASALDLAEDLRRFQAGEPIQARPAGTMERLAKWARRRPVVAGLLAAVLLVTVVGITGVTWAYQIALAERDIAQVQEKTAKDEKDKADFQKTQAEKQKKEADFQKTQAELQKEQADFQKTQAELQKEQAQNQKKEADFQKTQAELQREKADFQRMEAEAARMVAEKQTKEAEFHRIRAEKANEETKKQLLRAEGLVYIGQIAKAHDLLQKNDLLACRIALDETRWDLRGPEYGYLGNQLNGKARTIHGLRDLVYASAVSADGKRLFTAGGGYQKMDMPIKVWDLETGQELLTLPGHAATIQCLALAADGKRLFSGSFDKTIKVWDLAEGKELTTLTGHAGGVWGLAVTADGKRLVSAAASGRGAHAEVKVWDLDAAKEEFTLPEPNNVKKVAGFAHPARGLALASDGKRLFVGCPDRTVRIFDLEKKTEDPRLFLMSKGLPPNTQDAMFDVHCLALSRDGKRLCAGGPQLVKVFDVDTGAETLTLRGHHGGIDSLVWSADGKRLFSGSWDHTVKMWDTETGKDLLTLRGHDDYVHCLALLPDGKRLLSAGRDHTIKIWDLDAALPSEPFTHLPGPKVLTPSSWGQAFSLDGRRFMPPWHQLRFGPSPAPVKGVWDLEAGKEIFSWAKNPQIDAGTALMTGDGKRIFLPGRDKTIRLWDVDAGKELQVLRGPPGGLGFALASADGTRLFSVAAGNVTIWDVPADKEIHTITGFSTGLRTMAVSPDGTRLVTGSSDTDHLIQVFDVETGKRVYKLLGHANVHKIGAGTAAPGIHCLTVSADGKRLYSGSSDETARVWDLATGKEICTLSGHGNSTEGHARGAVAGLAEFADGKRLFSWSYDKTIKLWDVATGREIFTFPVGETWPVALARAKNGKQLIVHTNSGLYKIDLDPGRVPSTLRGHKAEIYCLALSPDGKRLISGGSGPYSRGEKIAQNQYKSVIFGAIKEWDLETGKEILSLRGHVNKVLALAAAQHDEKERLYSASADNTIKVWDAQTGDDLLTLGGHTKEVTRLTLTPDGTRLISGSSDETIKVWDLKSGKITHTLADNPGGVTCFALSADGNLLYSGNGGIFIKVWNLKTGNQFLPLFGHTGAVISLALSPDGKTLFSGSIEPDGSGEIKGWDLKTGLVLFTLRGHKEFILSLAVSADGKRLYSGSKDQTIKVWDLETRKDILTLHGHTDAVSSLIASADGKRLYSASWDQTIKVWNLETELAAVRPSR